MNSDLFFNPAVGTPAEPTDGEPQPSLETEMQQVIGQFGRFWGGVRKQSQSALDIARKDLTQVVDQARTELSKLGAEASQRISSELNRSSIDQAAPTSPEAEGAIASNETASPESTSHASLFDRLQSSLPPNIARHIPPPASLSALRADLTTQFSNIQTTLSHDLSQAERLAQEYGRKSEALLKEAGEFLKDAVKVVPPDQQTGNEGLVWDGSDMWNLPGASGPAAATGDAREKMATPQRSGSPMPELRVPTTRAEALLAQLRRSAGVLRVDPAGEERDTDEWKTWSDEHWGADWREKAEKEDTGDLKATKDALVPSEMDEETFWKRYFFRVFQIERDEERRKALLKDAVTRKEDEFSWDDEEDSTSPTAPTIAAAQVTTAPNTTAPVPAPQETTTPRPSTTFDEPTPSSPPPHPSASLIGATSSGQPSPRVSSDESYDVVGESSTDGREEEDEKKRKGKAEKKEDDSEDSDWE